MSNYKKYVVNNSAMLLENLNKLSNKPKDEYLYLFIKTIIRLPIYNIKIPFSGKLINS